MQVSGQSKSGVPASMSKHIVEPIVSYKSEEAFAAEHPASEFEVYEEESIKSFLNDLEKGSFQDLEKAKKDITKLTKKLIQVTRGGKTFTKTVYVKKVEDTKNHDVKKPDAKGSEEVSLTDLSEEDAKAFILVHMRNQDDYESFKHDFEETGITEEQFNKLKLMEEFGVGVIGHDQKEEEAHEEAVIDKLERGYETRSVETESDELWTLYYKPKESKEGKKSS